MTEEHDHQTRTSEDIELAAEFIEMLHQLPNCSAGGNLHIITDDWNIEDSNIDFCLERVRQVRNGELDSFFTDDWQNDLEYSILALLRPMSIVDRTATLVKVWGYDALATAKITNSLRNTVD